MGGFLVITVSHPTFCCVGVGLWLRWGWAVTIVPVQADIVLACLLLNSTSALAELGSAQL